ncbi:MAG: COR domain-containing protein [Bacteroidota bacterium]
MDKEKKTIEEQIDEAKNKKIKAFTFSFEEEKINVIPESIYQLKELEELNLNLAFSVEKISRKILQLKKLTKLSIDGDFKKFPLELMEMESLTELTISSFSLSELPVELNNWHKLEYLNLGSCNALSKINGLPPNLTYIYVTGQKFIKIPDKIFGLDKLAKAVLNGFKLKSLPNALFELKNLSSLFLTDNLLTSLPRGILKLNKLRDLWLINNSFDEFPEIITQIQSLKEINISENNLNDIPVSISNLTNLTYLNLGSNNFEVIPQSIFELKNLEVLLFGNFSIMKNSEINNNIKIIPIEILKLKKLNRLDLHKNIIENVPGEILKDGIEAIMNFLRSKVEADDEEYLYEAKMVVVGRGDVGKSVLTKKLSQPNYSLSKSATTTGISVLKNPFEFSMKGLKNTNSFRFNIWDFGGQEKYDATHQLFITNRSVYLFLTEARSESNYHDVFYWLNTISLFSYNSPVIIVLSKFDERKKILPESTYKDKFDNIVQFVDVSCADGYEHTIDSLKDAISEAIKLLPQTKLTLSNHWVEVRNKLEELSQNQDYIDYNDYLNICKNNKLDKERADFLSEYLNDLGVIIHHKQDVLLKKTVFIKTDWCVDGMYKILDNESVFQNKGKFSNSDLDYIWYESRFKNKQAELIRLMRDYGLCFELADGTGYIAPDLLPLDKPQILQWDDDSNLKFEYQYTFMPAGMLSRFIVKSHSFIKDNLYWKYGVVLKYDNTEALVEEDYINSKIKISLKGENKKSLLSAIKMFIGEVHKDFDKANKLVFEEMVPCNCSECIKSSNPHFFKFNVLRKFEQKPILEIPCDKSSESVKVKSLINDVLIQNPIDYFQTNDDLKNFILELFENILEKDVNLKGGYNSFWRDKACTDPKDEIEIQPYICNTLDNFCKTRGINLSREVKEGNGNVDILFSCTNKDNEVLRVCVEIKKSHHQDVETAINTQLPVYMKSAGTQSGIYFVVWLKNDSFKEPKKYKTLKDLKVAIDKNNPDKNNFAITILNCTKRVSPSKIKA